MLNRTSYLLYNLKIKVTTVTNCNTNKSIV